MAARDHEPGRRPPQPSGLLRREALRKGLHQVVRATSRHRQKPGEDDDGGQGLEVVNLGTDLMEPETCPRRRGAGLPDHLLLTLLTTTMSVMTGVVSKVPPGRHPMTA